MTPQEFIKSEGFARATRIAKSAPHWAIYYDAEKHCYDDIRCESSVCLLELEDVLQGLWSMSEFKVGDWVFDVLLDDVVRYHSGYDNLSDAHKDMVLRHATPKEIEEIKAGRCLS